MAAPLRTCSTSMKKTLLVTLLLFTALVLVPPRGARAGQDEDVLARDTDEKATTPEERERAHNVLLFEAGRLRDAGDLLKAASLLNRAGRLQLLLHRQQDALVTFRDALAVHESAP